MVSVHLNPEKLKHSLGVLPTSGQYSPSADSSENDKIILYYITNNNNNNNNNNDNNNKVVK